MIIITLAGYIFARIAKVTDEQQKFMSRLLLYFINPFLVLNSFNMEFSWLKFRQLWFAAFIALILHGVMILLGFLSSKEKIDRVAVAFTNCGFVGIPLIRGVFGDEGVFYLMGYLIVFNVLIWTYGYYQFCGATNVKKIITNPNIVAVAIGLVMFCLPFKLPELLQKPIVMIADINTPMAMLLLGILFARFEFDRTYIRRLVKKGYEGKYNNRIGDSFFNKVSTSITKKCDREGLTYAIKEIVPFAEKQISIVIALIFPLVRFLILFEPRKRTISKLSIPSIISALDR